MTNNKKDIKSLTLNQLIDEMELIGEKKFRANQVYEWLHQKQVNDFSCMTNLSEKLRRTLETNYQIVAFQKIDELASEKDETVKYLFALDDGQVIETVLMKYSHGYSVCISSQAGCKMGCKFCASTIGGLIRNLTPSEMLEQIYFIERNTGKSISNIVIMGTGEPFDNFNHLISFIRIINSKEGRNIGQRSITVSTCGLVNKIIEFADLELQVNLAISLHATTHEKREAIMPVEKKYNINQLLEGCRYYIQKTNRRITFEYALIHGVNDSVKDAKDLAKLLKGILCHINLIPVNNVVENRFEKSFDRDIKRFQKTLDYEGMNATMRRSLGEDIKAACGQLRRTYIEENK